MSLTPSLNSEPEVKKLNRQCIRQKVIVIEPAANVYFGHMREKLEVITLALKEIGVEYELSAWEVPVKPLSSAPEAIHEVTPLLRKMVQLVPARWRTRAMEFFVYLKGFRLARSKGLGVIGMTTSDPYGPLAASLICCPGDAYVQRMFNHGLRLHEGRYICSIPRLWAYEKLVRGGGRLLLFTDLLRDQLTGFRASLRGLTHVVPEFTKLPETEGFSPGKAVMLVSGLDNSRRAPLLHLSLIREHHGLNEIIIQFQETLPLSELKEKIGAAGNFCEVTWINSYFTGDEWEALFRRAGFTLVAYDSGFSSISAILLQSVIFGVPVLSSRFPDALENFQRHGQLGELFDYRNGDDFNAALRKILAWNREDYAAFSRARESLLKSMSPAVVALRYVELLAFTKTS